MRTQVFHSGGRRVLVVVPDKGEEALAAVRAAVEEHGMYAGQVTGVGAFQSAVLGYFDRERREYERIEVPGQTEVLSLLGDIAEQDGAPAVHLHAVLGHRDGTTVGGHLLRGEVWPTLEVMITEVLGDLVKQHDPETGLALLPTRPGRH